jgi:hypothetical protein
MSMLFLHNTSTFYSCVSRDLNQSVPVILLPAKWQALLHSPQFNSPIHSPICIFVFNLHTLHRNSCCCLHLTPTVKQIYLLSCVLSSTEENSFDFHGVSRNVYLFIDIAGGKTCVFRHKYVSITVFIWYSVV